MAPPPSLTDDILTWTQTRQTNRLIEAINDLYQVAKREARGLVRFSTTHTVFSLTARNRDFGNINPHAA